MNITHLYTGSDNQSHFEEISVPLHDQGNIGFLSSELAVNKLILRETKKDYHYDWHNAPCKQYMIMLKGEVDIEIGNGTVRRFGPGDIVLLNDLTGQGHISRAVNDKPRSCVFIVAEK